MINLKKYKNLIYLIIIFSLIIFTFSLVTSIVITDYKNVTELNHLKNSKTKAFKFDDSKKTSKQIEFKSLLQVLDKYEDSDIYLEFNPVHSYLATTTLFGKAIYYNYDLNNKIPILEGNNFTLQQMNSNEKLVLVGKNLKTNVTTENDVKYFTVDDTKYKVIGILGNGVKKTGYDDIFLINMKSMDYYSDRRATWSLNVSGDEDLNSILTLYQEIGEKNDSPLELVKNSTEDTKINIDDILDKYSDFIYIFIMIFGLGILNLIIIVYFWIDRSVKEIGIRKAYGATNFSIAKYILKKYEFSIIISVVLGVILHLIFKKSLNIMFPKFSFELYWGNIVIITLIFMFIGLMTAIIPLIKSRNVQPVIIMKGRLK